MFKWLNKSVPSLKSPVPRPHPDHRLYAIGDVHGRVDLLAKLLKHIVVDADSQVDERKPVLVFLGDLVDRGDHSRETLELVIKTMQIWSRSVCLRGNHEDALLAFLENPEDGSQWLNSGGVQTCASYGVPARNACNTAADLKVVALALALAMGPHRSFLEKTERIYRSGDVVFAHSGIDPEVSLETQSDAALFWGRSTFLDKGPPPGLRVVHGHWDGLKPVVKASRICVDTGAYHSGRLTAVRLDDETAFLTANLLDP